MSILPRWLGGRERRDDAGSESPVSANRQEAAKLIDFANAAEDEGDLALALQRINAAIEADPHYARAHLNLGNVLLAGGDIEGAIAATLAAIGLNEQYADAHYNLGRLRGMTGDAASAEKCYLKALELRPQFSKAAIALALELEKANRMSEAQSWLRRALADDPSYDAAAFNLFRLLLAQGRADEAEKVLRQAVEVNPELTEAYCTLGDLCGNQNRWRDAIDWYERAIAAGNPAKVPAIDSLLARTTVALGLLLVRENRWPEATKQFQRAIELLPESPVPYVKLASMEMRRARLLEALELLDKAIELDPGAWNLRSFRLFILNLRDDIEPQQLFTEHRRFGEGFEIAAPLKVPARSTSRDAERPLRVGYVSGDYRVHPVMIFLSPVLEEHDPANVQPFCYSNTKERDEVTEDLERRFGATWRDIARLDDDEVADLVIEDGIDILVDLSGHTDDSRLGIFTRKPAPVQVSWLGYLNTTGLNSIDYRLVDRFTDPVGAADELHTERLFRLPDSQWAYWPLFEVPILRREQPKGSQEVVFGSFNQFMKVSDRSLELWGRILSSLPDARLKVGGLPPGDFEEQLLHRLDRVGIASSRVTSTTRVPVMRYLEAFNQIDIALDAMPYNGATTTLDTLWMGVPVIGLAGSRSISRGTYSILKTLGMDELIAASAEEYVELNVRLARDGEWRRELHRTLREKMRRSALMDIPRFVRNLEAAYRQMWRDWCATARPT